jgi:hypothetical protein
MALDLRLVRVCVRVSVFFVVCMCVVYLLACVRGVCGETPRIFFRNVLCVLT